MTPLDIREIRPAEVPLGSSRRAKFVRAELAVMLVPPLNFRSLG